MARPTAHENRLKAKEHKKALLERLLAKKKPSEPVKDLAVSKQAQPAVEAVTAETKPESHVTMARFGQAGVALFDRGQPAAKLWPEPWLGSLVNAALETAAKKEIRLCLVWPGTVRSVALIHALATIERLAIGDKKGLRTLLYPTKRWSFAALNQFLLDRESLLDWARKFLTVTKVSGTQPPMPGRDDQNKDMLLMAVQSMHNDSPSSTPPSIAELFPNFDWEFEKNTWGHYGVRFLKRSKVALQRSHLWKKGDDYRIAELGHPQTAPDALFGISHQAATKQWKKAIKSEDLKGDLKQPELVLLDLTRDMRRNSARNFVRLVPDVIEEVTERWSTPPGFMVVTDDPRTYFTLRKYFREKLNGNNQRLVCDPILAVKEDHGLSEAPRPQGWVPPQVSLRHFNVGVLDQEAAAEAARFWHIARELEQDSPAHLASREAAAFLMRLANLPGGYHDYIAWMEAIFPDAMRSSMTWNGHVTSLASLSERGDYGHHAEAVRRAVTRATKLVEAYNEATPIAKRIAKEVSLCASRNKAHVTVAFRYSSDIPVAKSFLERYTGFPDGQPFSSFQDRVAFVNHKELPDILNSGEIPTKFLFAGLPDETLRLLITSERVPADSLIVLDCRRANDVLSGLRSLQTVDVYKPYRGRIAGLADEIERRIAELPNVIDLEKLESMRIPRLSLSAAVSEASRNNEGQPDAWKLELEGGQKMVAGHRVYIYDPDETKAFHQKNIEKVQEGDLVFVMSDELKDLFESSLIQAGNLIHRGSTYGEMLQNYHRDVLSSAKRLFGDLKALPLARKIHERMVALDHEAEKCSLSRIRYWIDVKDSDETPPEDLKPHSTWSKADFVRFARALEIAENLIGVYWDLAAGQRKALQSAGRELAERYAHVLFNEETAEVLYQLKRETILGLQHEALRNLHRVEKVIAPTNGAKENSNDNW